MASTSITFIALFTNSHFFGEPANLNFVVVIIFIIVSRRNKNIFLDQLCYHVPFLGTNQVKSLLLNATVLIEFWLTTTWADTQWWTRRCRQPLSEQALGCRPHFPRRPGFQSINKSNNQSNNQSINQTINQSNKQTWPWICGIVLRVIPIVETTTKRIEIREITWWLWSSLRWWWGWWWWRQQWRQQWWQRWCWRWCKRWWQLRW